MLVCIKWYSLVVGSVSGNELATSIEDVHTRSTQYYLVIVLFCYKLTRSLDVFICECHH